MSVGRFIPGWARRAVATLMERMTPSNAQVLNRWCRVPQLREDAEVCIFMSYAPESIMPEHSRYHARAWADAGFEVIVVLNSDSLERQVPVDELAFASGVLVRENRGYDFGAWATALHQLPVVRTAPLVALANDSMYGPLDTFGRMLERVRATDADVIGVVESREFGRHFQSFLLFFKPGALNSKAFWSFWGKVRAGGRIIAVYRYEQGLIRTLEAARLRCVALFESPDARNPTLTRWKALIDEGLPYLKIALLRKNPFRVDLTGWEEALRNHGYDPAMASRHCGRP